MSCGAAQSVGGSTPTSMLSYIRCASGVTPQFFLSDRGLETYWAKMLIGYAKLQRFKTTIDDTDIPLPSPKAIAEKMF